MAICIAVAISIATRTPFKVDVIRDRSTMGRQVEDGWLENIYRLQVMNATESNQTYRVTADGLPGLTQTGTNTLTLGPAQAEWMVVSLRVPPETVGQIKSGAHEIHFTIEKQASTDEAARSLREKSTFIVPR